MKIYTLAIAGLILLGLFLFLSQSEGSTANSIHGVPEIKSGYEHKHIYREVEVVINRNADEYFREFTHTPLKYFLPGTDKLAGVETTKSLTKNEFPEAGSVRRVILKNGETANEEVVELQTGYFRYKVTDYTTEQAKPLEYGVGEFRFIPVTENSFLLCWKYSFKLKEDKFPGNIGCIGRGIFKKIFVDSDWAEYMDSSINAIQAHAKRNFKTR
jgi:hypothetical protein